MTLNDELLQIASDPFGPLPKAYATFVGTVSPAQVDSIPANQTPGILHLYEHQVQFADFGTLLTRLEEASLAFPALEPRLSVMKGEVRTRLGQAGPAYLYYTGCTISGSPESRASNDLKVTGSLVTNMLSFWNVDKVSVFQVNLPGEYIDAFEYRASLALQREEHSLIAVRFPLSLNSAPGGFSHDYRLDLYDARPFPSFARQPVPFSMVDAVRRHIVGAHNACAAQPGSPAGLSSPYQLGGPGAPSRRRDASPDRDRRRRTPRCCISTASIP